MDLVSVAQAFRRDELLDRETYRFLASRVNEPRLRQGLERIAAMEARHAAFWEGVLAARGVRAAGAPPAPRLRVRALAALARVVNPFLLVSVLELGESAAYERYFETLIQAPLSREEQQALRRIILDELEHERFFHAESEALGAGHVRDFVLGMNDGLVELLGTVAGLAAVYPGAPAIVGTSGLVVGLAGGLSMGIGAFVSVRSQRQVDEARRRRARILLEVAPERIAADVRERLVASGVAASVADEVISCVAGRPAVLEGLLVPERHEDELRSGLLTGGAYVAGAVLPVVPFFVADSSLAALPVSVGLAGALLAAAGSAVALLSGIRMRTKVAEMVLAGLSAAGLSFAFGHLLQSALGVPLP